MSKKYFILNGVSSAEYDVYVYDDNFDENVERDIEAISVPGRSGDLHRDNGRYVNKTRRLSCYIDGTYEESFHDFRAFIASCTAGGYTRLEYSRFADQYFMAMPTGEIEPERSQMYKIGTFDIEFDCKPQRYLTSGEAAVTVSSGDTISNPTLFDSQPLIHAYGYGTITIGNYGIVIAEHDSEYMDVDSEIMDAFCGSVNLNSYLTLGSDKFPQLAPGASAVTFDDTITSLEITPRWWTL